MRAVFKAFLLLLALAALALAALVGWVGSRGISARAEPGAVETAVARTMRRFAIPRNARARENPVQRSEAAIDDGMAHYADHCASCHANDGSGDTSLGRGLYPKAPDMRRPDTQSLSDGELFYIIENGIRLTGMPAWSTGAPEGETSTWHLVHFIRELPRLTGDRLDRMQQLNPRSLEELRQEIEEEKFLRGEDHTGAHE